jgi:hypothetical protein
VESRVVRALALVALAGCLGTPSRPLDGDAHVGDGKPSADASPFAPDAPAFSGGYLLGDMTDWQANDNHVAGSAEASSFIARATGAISHLGFYYDAAPGVMTVEIGVYDGASTMFGDPGSLLGKATITAPAEGWNDTAINPSIAVTAGTLYWIAVVSPKGTAGNVAMNVHYAFTPNIAKPAGSGGSANCTVAFGTCTTHSAESTLSGLPATWSPGERFDPSINSFYGRDQ